MPAPALKHYKATNPATANTIFEVVPTVAASRALAVSKVIAWNLQGVSATVTLFVGDTTIGSIISIVDLATDKEGYVETGLVLLAGERLLARTNNATAGTLVVSVFGEEVDN